MSTEDEYNTLVIDSNDNFPDELPEWASSRVDSRFGFLGRDDSIAGHSSKSRVRSIECTSIEVNIVGHEIVQKTEKSGPFAMYLIEVAPGLAKRWIVRRRYTDFSFLDTQLRKTSLQSKVQLKLPPLPGKRYFGSSIDQKFVQERRNQLQEYLQALVGIPHVWVRSDLPRFLDNEENSMIFIWNFERVKRMEEIVNTMTIESKNDKDKLTEELNSAREQVETLQNRIRQMEMMFLQHAAGVAPEPLPSRVVRSISGAHHLPVGLGSLTADPDDDSVDSDTNKLSSSPYHNGPKLMGSADSNIEEIDEIAAVENALSMFVTSGKPMENSEIMEVLRMASEVTNKDDARRRSSSNDELRAWALSMKLRETVELGNEILNDQFYLRSNNITKKQSFSVKSDVDSISTISSHKYDLAYNATDTRRKYSDHTIDESSKRFLAYNYVVESHESESDGVSGKDVRSPDAHFLLFQYFDQIIYHLIPSPETQEERVKIFDYLRTLIYYRLGAHIFPVGSFLLNTYLPDGDIDVTGFFLHSDDESWFVKVNEILCMTAFEGSGFLPLLTGASNSNSTGSESPDLANRNSSRFTINNVSFVNADIKLIKSSINGVSIDLSANQIGALYLQCFLEQVNTFIGNHNLFKRSIILIKAWCSYESSKYSHGSGGIVGSKEGRLSTSSLNVMTAWIFNYYGRSITHPLQALYYFLSYYSVFDWHKYAITIHGPVSAEDLSEIPIAPSEEISPSGSNTNHMKPPTNLFFSDELMDNCKNRYLDGKESSIVNALQPVLQSLGYQCSYYSGQSVRPNASTSGETNVTLHSRSDSITSYAEAYESTIQHIDPATVLTTTIPEISEERTRFLDSWIMTAAFGDVGTYYKRGLMNVMNPVAPKNNISRSVDSNGFRAIQCALKEGLVTLRNFIDRIDHMGQDLLKQKKSDPSLMTLAQYLLVTSGTASSNGTMSSDSSIGSAIANVICEYMSNTAYTIILPIIRGSLSSYPSRRQNASSQSISSQDLSQNVSNNSCILSSDLISISSEDLEFSLSFTEMMLGSKVRQDCVITLVTQVLLQRGSLPVGELGKMLQLLVGNDSVSRRVKDQFGGLKKTIENALGSGIDVGKDHPFNPILTLDSSLSSSSIHNKPNHSRFNHASRIVQHVIAMNIKEPGTKDSHNKNWNSSNVSISGTGRKFRSHPSSTAPGGGNNSSNRPVRGNNIDPSYPITISRPNSSSNQSYGKNRSNQYGGSIGTVGSYGETTIYNQSSDSFDDYSRMNTNQSQNPSLSPPRSIGGSGMSISPMGGRLGNSGMMMAGNYLQSSPMSGSAYVDSSSQSAVPMAISGTSLLQQDMTQQTMMIPGMYQMGQQAYYQSTALPSTQAIPIQYPPTYSQVPMYPMAQGSGMMSAVPTMAVMNQHMQYQQILQQQALLQHGAGMQYANQSSSQMMPQQMFVPVYYQQQTDPLPTESANRESSTNATISTVREEESQ